MLERAFAIGDDAVVVALPAADDPDLAGPYGLRLDSAKHWVHPDDAAVFARATSHLLSFNAPEHADSGACRVCAGTGVVRRLREEVLVAHPTRSMGDGAFAIWTEKNYKYVHIQHETIEGLRGMRGFSPETPWAKLSDAARQLVLNGSGDELVFDRDRRGCKIGAARPFPGFRKIILQKSATGTAIADQLAVYVETGPCEECGGTRWSRQARALRVAGHGIADILDRTFADLVEFADSRGAFARGVGSNDQPLVEAIRRHAHSIDMVGLGYLTPSRGMLDVSEGESRRIRLARVLDAGESGLCLLLDEPARGLHESDLSRLGVALERLRGNHTLIINEHRERLWDVADWLIEVGPGAGSRGGEITYAGPPAKRPRTGVNEPRRMQLAIDTKHPTINIRGASIHNVENVDCEIPVGRLTCISGVSGSGKSSFIRGVLAPALMETVGGSTSDFALRKGSWRSISGASRITEVVALDQAMPPANRRSLVATFTDLFDNIRKIFGASPDAKREGLTAADFGTNAGHGRCSVCSGVGQVVDGELWSICPACGGARYGHHVLAVRVAGMNVQELLDTPFDELRGIASEFRIPSPLIDAMCDLGIGYIALGRRVDTLSGGEVQRLRLAMRLGRDLTGSMLFILDEPAVGLHVRDVVRLASALERVVDRGRNTVVVVEHDLRLIASADWVLEFGPGSGPAGGQIVFAGTPAELARKKTPTGLALSAKLPKGKSGESTPLPRPRHTVPLEEQVARTNALLRTLITGDAGVSTPEDGVTEPIVIVSERFWQDREPWEVAGLDLEVPKLLLDLQHVESHDVLASVLDEWRKHSSCWVAIQPFLSDMQIWGAELPSSLLREVKAHISKEGLRLVTQDGGPAAGDVDIREMRASGPRFVPADDGDESRLQVLRDAFAVGAHYVELRDRNGRLRASASDRLLDLNTSIIGPMAAIPSHFTRHDPLGRCPMCKGKRNVTAVAESLVIANPKATPDSDDFLTAEANVIMKGILRNELKPFLRRLEQEGLWDGNRPFARLDDASRESILFGFWSRPGAGSFLKKNADPGEVASWLRWDGLYRHVLDQLHRSGDSQWVQQLRASERPIRCPRCQGSGLQRFATLLRVGTVPFDKWVRMSEPRAMRNALADLDTESMRQRTTKQRILHCLAPLAHERERTSVAIVMRAVESFTTMPSADPPLET
jgi:excinuclease ABC A subunit